MLYFCETARPTLTAEDRASAPEHAFPPNMPTVNAVVPTTGPGGNGGVLIGVDRPGRPVKFLPDRQKWQPIVGRDGWWIGFDRDAPPTPDTLARRRMLDGHPIELCDGHAYIAPFARKATELDGRLSVDVALPLISTRDADGHWLPGRVHPDFESFWALAATFEQRYWLAHEEGLKAHIERGGSIDEPFMVTVEFDAIHNWACDVLAVNYRIGADEADLLGLLSNDAAFAVMKAACDFPTRDAWTQKKSASDSAGGNTCNGETA